MKLRDLVANVCAPQSSLISPPRGARAGVTRTAAAQDERNTRHGAACQVCSRLPRLHSFDVRLRGWFE